MLCLFRWSVLLIACIAACLGGCGTAPTRVDAGVLGNERYPQAGEPVLMRRTVIMTEAGPVDMGVRRYRASTLDFIRRMPLASFSADDNGFIHSFSPAFPPLDGVQTPPFDVALKYVKFDRDGRLSGWELNDDPEALCRVRLIQIPGGPPNYVCRNTGCTLTCVLVYVTDEDGNVTVECDCSVFP